jgi:hypothetical protein
VRLAAVHYSDRSTDFFRDAGFGTIDLELFAYASPDFNVTLRLNGLPPIPELDSIGLVMLGIFVLGGFDRDACVQRAA